MDAYELFRGDAVPEPWPQRAQVRPQRRVDALPRCVAVQDAHRMPCPEAGTGVGVVPGPLGRAPGAAHEPQHVGLVDRLVQAPVGLVDVRGAADLHQGERVGGPALVERQPSHLAGRCRGCAAEVHVSAARGAQPRAGQHTAYGRESVAVYFGQAARRYPAYGHEDPLPGSGAADRPDDQQHLVRCQFHMVGQLVVVGGTEVAWHPGRGAQQRAEVFVADHVVINSRSFRRR